MKKYVPLIAIGSQGKANSVMQTGKLVSLTSIPKVSSTYILQYDADRGILYSIQPDGKVVETSGFNTKYSIGVGETGFRGNSGVDGADGVAGKNGNVGIAGPRGEVGATGFIGDVGDRGDMGPKGPRGPTGPKGPRGDYGLVGRQGPQGDKGLKGFAGASKNIVVAFSYYEPEYPLRPGSVWYRLIPRIYSGSQQAQCGSASFLVENFVAGLSSTRSITPKKLQSAQWKILTISDVTRLRNLFSVPCVTRLSERVYDVFSKTYYEPEDTDRIWKNSGVAWCSFDPLIHPVLIDATNKTFQIVEQSDTYIFYDRSGKCPGIPLEKLCQVQT